MGVRPDRLPGGVSLADAAGGGQGGSGLGVPAGGLAAGASARRDDLRHGSRATSKRSVRRRCRPGAWRSPTRRRVRKPLWRRSDFLVVQDSFLSDTAAVCGRGAARGGRRRGRRYLHQRRALRAAGAPGRGPDGGERCPTGRSCSRWRTLSAPTGPTELPPTSCARSPKWRPATRASPTPSSTRRAAVAVPGRGVPGHAGALRRAVRSAARRVFAPVEAASRRSPTDARLPLVLMTGSVASTTAPACAPRRLAGHHQAGGRGAAGDEPGGRRRPRCRRGRQGEGDVAERRRRSRSRCAVTSRVPGRRGLPARLQPRRAGHSTAQADEPRQRPWSRWSA